MSEVLTSFRHKLHAHPELAHAEHATADRVVAFMQQFNPTEMVTGIAGTGVVVTFDSGVEGRRMLFPCELDALPIVEIGVDGYTSVDAGVSHKCGHEIITPDVGMRAGEDFGLFTERFPCCLVLLGAREDHLPIHNAAYDFPDELIATGVELFEQIVRDAEDNFETTLRTHLS